MSDLVQGMDLGGLERPDLHVLFFRVSFDLGFAIEEYRPALTTALALRNKSLFEFLRLRSRNWVDVHIEQFEDKDYQKHLEVIRASILAEKAGSPEPDGLFAVYDKIAKKLSGMEPLSLAEKLKCMCDETRELVTQALERFGGPRAVAGWQSCYPASLVFRHGERGPTYCSFKRGSADVITIHIGNHLGSDNDRKKGALRTYYNMHFYFFHEYLSHSFSYWQETEFVEGYLVWAAKKMHFYVNRDIVRRRFIEDTFDDDQARRTEAVADWFQATTDDRFLKFLLEWAADDGYQEDTRAWVPHAETLWALDCISQMCTNGKPITNDVCSAFDQTDAQATRDKLRSIAQQATGMLLHTSRLQ